MKRILILLPLVALLLLGCGPSGNTFKIKGEFTGMKAGDLYLLCPSDPAGRIDTLTIVDGKFAYEGETEDTVPYILLFPNALEQVIFVSPGKIIEYKAAANDLKNYVVTGTDENEELNTLRAAVSDKNSKQTILAIKEYITANPQSLVSAYLYDRYYIQSPSADIAESKQLLATLRQHQPNNLRLAEVEGLLSTAGVMATGSKMPDIKLKKGSKSTARLWDKKSDYTLIFFWASNQSHSYDFMWRVRQYRDNYTEGLRFVGISLDNEIYRWEESSKRDSTIIDHYCDGLSWSSPEISKIGLSSLPYYVITDRSHKILATGTEVEQMGKDLSKYVK